MIVINDLQNSTGKGWVATVGFFDGVHLGHRYLISELRRIADKQNLPSAVFTFPIHPRVIMQADYQPKLLNSFDEKLGHLATTGIDYCAVLDFTIELANYSACDFISLLAKKWHVKTLLVGHDHRFGHNREEGFHEYVKYGIVNGVDVIRATSFIKDGETISSSKIRQLLMRCNINEAAELLTYPYRLTGHVISGYQIGRKLGFPTANIMVDDVSKVWPGMGVYAVWVHIEEKRYAGMLAIGNRPTFEDETITLEVHLLNFSGIIYNEKIVVEFIRYIRANKKFTNIEELKAQLFTDKEQVKNILAV